MLLQALHMLEGIDLKSMGFNSPKLCIAKMATGRNLHPAAWETFVVTTDSQFDLAHCALTAIDLWAGIKKAG